MNVGRWIGLGIIVVLAGLFAYFNGAERVALSLGFATFYRVSLVAITFGAFILGMVTMFLLGLRHDLRVRRALRERGLLERQTPIRVEEETAPSDWRTPPSNEMY